MKGLVTTALATWIVGCSGPSSNPKAQVDLEASITQGTTREVAERKLEALGFEWEYVPKDRTLRARRRDPERGLVTESLIVRIALDPQSRVDKLEIERAFTGP